MGRQWRVWNAGGMVLPICIIVSVVAVVLGVLMFVRGRAGRGVQLLGLAAVPIGLYLSGLLGLVLDGALALWRWVQQLALNPMVTTGLGLLGLAVVLWVVGGWLARRRATRRALARSTGTAPAVGARTSTSTPPTRPVGSGTAPKGRAQQAPADPEMDEIEALLRKRGIE